MSGTQQGAGQSGQQNQGAGQSGQQNQGAGSGQQDTPAPMSDKAAQGLANLLGSFLVDGWTAEIVDPTKGQTPPAS